LKLYVHVGLPKTATSFLQKSFFPSVLSCDEYFYPKKQDYDLGHFFNFVYGLNKVYDPVLPAYCYQPSALSKRSLLRSRDRVKHDLLRLKAKLEARNTNEFYISSEGLVGVSWNPLLNNKDNIRIISQFFPEIKVLLVIRRQDEWARSLYRQLVFQEDRFCCYLKIEELFPNGVDQLNWMHIYENYADAVGKENVKLMPFEMFKEEPKAFLEEISTFLDIDAGEISVDINRKINSGTVFNYSGHQWESMRLQQLILGLPMGSRIRRVFLGCYKNLLNFVFPSKSYAKAFDAQNDSLSLTPFIKGQNRLLADYSGTSLRRYGYY
jgi:hypothetical protein